MKISVRDVSLNIPDSQEGREHSRPFWSEGIDTYTIYLNFTMSNSEWYGYISFQTHKRRGQFPSYHLNVDNLTETIKNIHAAEFPDIEFVREADKVHHEPGVMRIFAQSEEEELEFLRFFGWSVWDAPYDSRERLMRHLAATAGTHNASVHGIVATGSFAETE